MRKKLLIFVVVILFFVAFAYSGSGTITVKKPNSQNTWIKGNTYKIVWSKSGNMDSQVKITLYKPDHKSLIYIIAKPTPNNGSFLWTIPNSIPSGKYLVRVKTMDNSVYDDGEVFKIDSLSNVGKYAGIIKPDNSKNIGAILDAVNPGKNGKLKTINIISPTGGKWKEGSTMTIKWEGKSGEEFAIYLVSFDKKEVEKVIRAGFISLSRWGDKSKLKTYDWKIPERLFANVIKYIGDHRIKIVRKKDGAVGYSKPFHIFASIKTHKYKIYAKTTNTYHWKNKKKSSIIGGAPFVLGFKYDDPGNGKLRVGYANTYKEDSITYNYYGEAYRAHAFFDVSKLKGKGLITKATLHYHHYKGNYCGLRIYRVTKPFSNLFNASIELIENPQGNLSSLVRKWVRNPSFNHGIIFTGVDESFSHNNNKCVDYYDNVYMEIEVLER